MPRIISSQTTKETVTQLKRVAKRNHRSAGREALIAITSHIVNELAKPEAKTS